MSDTVKIVGSQPESGISPPNLQQRRNSFRSIKLQSMKLGQRFLVATELGEVWQLIKIQSMKLGHCFFVATEIGEVLQLGNE